MKEISIVVCFDENYALNGAMTIYSAARNVREGTKIKAYVIDGGVRKRTKRRFEKLAKDNLEIIWLNPDLSIFDNLPFSPWTTRVTHARLLIQHIIPRGTKKILYLDSDMLVLKDIAELWEISLDDNVLLAVQDSKYPYVHKKPNSGSLIDAGMKPSSPYFNAGLLLINIPRWENINILDRYVEMLSVPGKRFTHCNQDPLNIILEDKWKPLDQHWQVLSPCFYSPDEEDRRTAENASIIHFTGIPPGFAKCRHPKRAFFYACVYSSGWFSKWGYFGWKLKLLIKCLGYMIDSVQQKLSRKLFRRNGSLWH